MNEAFYAGAARRNTLTDPILDMGRSATNVLGNSLAAAAVSRWEGALK